MLKTIEVKHPYPGLRPFESHEAEIFFGRDDHADRLLEILEREHFLAVIGPSGCGKSSLVRAGLLPGVGAGWLDTDGEWRIVRMHPGDQPMRDLAQCLARADACGAELNVDGNENRTAFRIEAELTRGPRGLIDVFRTASARTKGGQLNLLVLVDQFEELFEYAKRGEKQADEAAAFVELLLESKGEKSAGIYVVMTMRTDYLGDCVRFLQLPDAINRAQYLTPRLNRDEMREAIERPARLFRSRVQERLVTHLINSIGGESDRLPILQHALSRMWEKTGGAPKLTEEHLCDVGGVADALSKHATEVYAELSAGEQKLAEHLFRFITERTSPEDGSRDVSRRRSLTEIAAAMEGTQPSDFVPIVEKFSDEGVNFLAYTRPLTEDKKIAISHEALIRKWVLLQQWVTEESNRAAEYREWRSRAKSARGDLLSGGALARADLWLEGENSWKPSARWAERYTAKGYDPVEDFATTKGFIERSRAEEKARREREVNLALEQAYARRMRLWAFGLGALALVAFMALGVAVRKWREASIATDRAARLAKKEGESAKRARDSELHAIEVAKQLSFAEQNARDDERTARLAKVEATMARDRAEEQAVIARNLKLAAMESARSATDAADREKDAREQSEARLIIAKSENYENTDPDRAQLFAIAAYEKRALPETVRLLRQMRLGFAAQLATYRGHTDGLIEALFSPEGNRVVTTGRDKTVRLWDVATGAATTIAADTDDYGIVCAAFSPDGRTVMTLGDVAQLWDAATGKPIRTFNGALGPDAEDSPVFGSFSKDGTRFAAVFVEGGVRLWEIATGRLIAILKRPDTNEERVTQITLDQVAFSPDGQKLATVESDGLVRIWDGKTGRALMVLKNDHPPEVDRDTLDYLIAMRDIEFSPDSKRVVATDAHQAAIWDVTTGTRIAQVSHAPDSRVLKARFSHNGEKIVTAGSDSSARVWAAQDGTPVASFTHGGGVRDAVFGIDDNTLVTASDDRDARVWDLSPSKTPSIVTTPILTFKGHRNAVVSVRLSKDGKTILTASQDGTARLWRARGERSTQVPSPPLLTASWARAGDGVLAVGADGVVRLYRNHQQVAAVDHRAKSLAAVQSPDGKKIVTASGDGIARLWDAATSTELREIRWREDDPAADPKKRETFSANVVFSPDSSAFLITGDSTPRLWSAADGSLIRPFTKSPQNILRTAFSKAGWVAAVDATGIVHVYEVATGRETAVFAKEKEELASRVIFTPYGSDILTTGRSGTFTTGRSDGTVRLWNLAGALLHTFEHGASVQWVSFSRDGSFIVTAGDDSQARVWSVRSGREIATLTGHTAPLTYASFSPDGRLIVTASIDRTARLWEFSGEPLDTLSGHRGPVRLAQFAPDDSMRLLTTSADGTARIWDVSATAESPEEMMEAIRRRVNRRELTPEEWAEAGLEKVAYVHDEPEGVGAGSR